MTDEKMIEKIEKLLAKANRAGTEAEAETFFAKAQELMTKWAIDEAVLLSRKGGQERERPTTEVVMIKRSGYHRAMVDLIVGVSSANDVKVLWRSPSNWGTQAGVTLIGFPSDIERVKLLYTSLLLQLTRERSRQTPPDLKLNGSNDSDLGRWRKSFSHGFAWRVGERLKAQKEATEQAADVEAGGSLLPVLASKKGEVEAFFQGLSKGTARPSRAKLDGSAVEAGRSSANRADLGNPGVRGARGSLGR